MSRFPKDIVTLITENDDRQKYPSLGQKIINLLTYNIIKFIESDISKLEQWMGIQNVNEVPFCNKSSTSIFPNFMTINLLFSQLFVSREAIFMYFYLFIYLELLFEGMATTAGESIDVELTVLSNLQMILISHIRGSWNTRSANSWKFYG